MLKRRIFTFAAAMLLAAACLGANDEGASGGQFLRIGAGAKASALGESGSASSGVQSMFQNPAGLNDVKNAEFSFSQVQWIMDIKYSNLAVAKRAGGGVYGLALNYLSAPPIGKFDKFGNKLPDDYTVRDMAAALGYSRKLTSRIGLGLDIKYISSKLETEDASAVAADAGVKYAAVPGSFNVGFVAQNIGTQLKYRDEGDPLPLNFKFGGQYTLDISDDMDTTKNVSLFTDLNHLRDSGFYANFGAEFLVRYSETASFAVRGGYKTNVADNSAGLSFGFGLDARSYVIDYAYSVMGDLGKAHRISLTLRFDGKNGGGSRN